MIEILLLDETINILLKKITKIENLLKFLWNFIQQTLYNQTVLIFMRKKSEGEEKTHLRTNICGLLGRYTSCT